MVRLEGHIGHEVIAMDFPVDDRRHLQVEHIFHFIRCHKLRTETEKGVKTFRP